MTTTAELQAERDRLAATGEGWRELNPKPAPPKVQPVKVEPAKAKPRAKASRAVSAAEIAERRALREVRSGSNRREVRG